MKNRMRRIMSHYNADRKDLYLSESAPDGHQRLPVLSHQSILAPAGGSGIPVPPLPPSGSKYRSAGVCQAGAAAGTAVPRTVAEYSGSGIRGSRSSAGEVGRHRPLPVPERCGGLCRPGARPAGKCGQSEGTAHREDRIGLALFTNSWSLPRRFGRRLNSHFPNRLRLPWNSIC